MDLCFSTAHFYPNVSALLPAQADNFKEDKSYLPATFFIVSAVIFIRAFLFYRSLSGTKYYALQNM